jgi:hypothetical protein
VSPVRYELGFHIPEIRILHTQSSVNLKFYMKRGVWSYTFSGNTEDRPVKGRRLERNRRSDRTGNQKPQKADKGQTSEKPQPSDALSKQNTEGVSVARANERTHAHTLSSEHEATYHKYTNRLTS